MKALTRYGHKDRLLHVEGNYKNEMIYMQKD